MHTVIQNGLCSLEKNEVIKDIRPVSGGDINEAFYVRTNQQPYFVKLNQSVDRSFFEIEKQGLEMIQQTETIHVPKVSGVVEDEDSNIPMLWLEWIEGKKQPETDQWLGERLARLHLYEASGYGLEGTSYIGSLQQVNQLQDNWLSYYRDFRLGGQLQIGRERQTITGKREKQLIRLMENLEKWIPQHPKSSILHGDLWGGNWMVGPQGQPYLIDPSLLQGHHEFELAFTEVFGGFSSAFYDAYFSTFPVSDEYQSRKDLYQLFYLLVHLNLFGEGYGRSVDRILSKYV